MIVPSASQQQHQQQHQQQQQAHQSPQQPLLGGKLMGGASTIKSPIGIIPNPTNPNPNLNVGGVKPGMGGPGMVLTPGPGLAPKPGQGPGLGLGGVNAVRGPGVNSNPNPRLECRYCSFSFTTLMPSYRSHRISLRISSPILTPSQSHTLTLMQFTPIHHTHTYTRIHAGRITPIVLQIVLLPE